MSYFNQPKRPKIHIPKSKSEIIGNIIGYVIYIGSIILLIALWAKIPQKVPVHYNLDGEVTRWGSKWELFILVGIGLFIIILMEIIERFPEIYNYPSRFNEHNAEQFYLVGRQMVNLIKNGCVILFSFILYADIALVLEWHVNLSQWILPIIFIICIVPIVVCFVRFSKIK